MRRTDVLVLCYHAVSPWWPSEMAVRPDVLRQQVEWLLERGYTPAIFADAVLRPPAPKTFAVTFDDGYISVLDHGFPTLSALGVPATIFVSTNTVDEQPQRFSGTAHLPYFGTPHEHELYGMDWDELRGVADAGWEIGSHAMNHPLLSRVDDARLDRELKGSRARVEEVLGRRCGTLAYPSGDFDERVIAAAGRAGYESACTVPQRFPKIPLPLAWPRVLVKREDGLAAFKIKTSAAVRFARTTQLWPVADHARLAFRRDRGRA